MTGFYRTDKELGITMDMYGHRNVFFGFDLTTTGTPAGLCFESSKSQNMEIEADIREAKEFPIEMIVYAEYDAELEIQPGGKVVMHSNAYNKMNSEQIENALKKNASTAPHFQGVNTRDTLPRKPRQGFYVVNFDKMGGIRQSLGVHAYRQVIKHLL